MCLQQNVIVYAITVGIDDNKVKKGEGGLHLYAFVIFLYLLDILVCVTKLKSILMECQFIAAHSALFI